MSSLLQNQWAKEELCRRASAWARHRAWPSVTIASFLKWKQEGLLPRPVVKSLGRGRGSSSGWPSRTYRQLLRILYYRHRGFRLWRDLRIALWLDGYDIDLGRIREDIDDLYQQMVRSLNRELQTEIWEASEDSAPSEAARRVISRRVTGPAMLETAVQRLELDPITEPLVRFGMSTLLTPEGQRLSIAFVHQFFADGPGDIPSAMAAFRKTLPTAFGGFLEGVETDFVRHAGMLARPDEFNNPLLIGIREATDSTLLNIRDAANQANRIWQSGFRLAEVFLRIRPELLGPFRLMAPVLVHIAAKIGTRAPFQSPEARAVAMALALASPSVRANEATRLSLGVRGMAALGEWLSLHPELIEGLDMSDEKWNTLANGPDFPVELKRLLDASGTQTSDRIDVSSIGAV